MSDRVTTSISTIPSAPAVAGESNGRFGIVGQTQKGPSTEPRIVTSLAGYETAFGNRAGGSSMYDAAQLAFRSGVSELVVQRAVGPTPVKATISLDTGKIVVTAKDPGAFANGWTAAWTASTKTLTIVAGSVTETHVGTTAAALILAVANGSNLVTVTSSGTLPSSNVAATALATGDDDFANVSWATPIALLSPDLGDFAVAVPGIAYGTVGQILATHCKATARHGLLTAAQGATASTLATALATVAAYTDSDYVNLVGPWVVVPDGAGATRIVDPTPFVAGLRAKALRVGPGESAAAEVYAKGIVDVTPEYQVSSADWATLNTAGVSVIRTVAGITRLYSYQTAGLLAGNTRLRGGHYRDIVNHVLFDGVAIIESYTNLPATRARLAEITGRFKAMLSPYTDRYLKARSGADGSFVDPGFRVDVTSGASAADNSISANVGLRLEESIDFADFTVAVGDATAAL